MIGVMMAGLSCVVHAGSDGLMRHLAVLAFVLSGCANDLGASRQRFVDLFYAAGVATYCSGLTDVAVDGLKRAVERERAITSLAPADQDSARHAGYIAADYEWSNRGLGGFRRWCLTEGALSVRWLEALGGDPTLPLPNGIKRPHHWPLR